MLSYAKTLRSTRENAYYSVEVLVIPWVSPLKQNGNACLLTKFKTFQDRDDWRASRFFEASYKYSNFFSFLNLPEKKNEQCTSVFTRPATTWTTIGMIFFQVDYVS